MKYEKMKKADLIDLIKTLKEENASLADENASLSVTASKRLETLKKRIERSRKRENEREDTIQGLFSLYSTVILEERWNDRIEWKNQILEEIQYLIRYIG
tara:strand:+ start:275 stop:574 length:300 start_codon:yes stop_codon:yes gene_type:complete